MGPSTNRVNKIIWCNNPKIIKSLNIYCPTTACVAKSSSVAVSMPCHFSLVVYCKYKYRPDYEGVTESMKPSIYISAYFEARKVVRKLLCCFD